jgi:hypothetical protein
MDLSNDWLRKDGAVTGVYYGYTSDLAATDNDRTWAVYKITTNGSVESKKWSDNIKLAYIGKWSERAAMFNAPVGTPTITYTTNSNSFGVVNINLAWSYLTGVNTYKLYISDQNGITYNSLNLPFSNANQGEVVTSIVNGERYTFSGKADMTYTIKVTGINAVGTTSSTIEVSTYPTTTTTTTTTTSTTTTAP